MIMAANQRHLQKGDERWDERRKSVGAILRRAKRCPPVTHQ